VDATVRDSLERVLGAGFRLGRELGGGMSRVFLATDLALDRQVVVKVLSAEESVGVSGARFRREIQLVAKLQHPHIVPILSAGDADGALYYIMPFLPGESLRARLTRDGPLKIAEALGIVRETLDALAFAHAHGVIHRDIKPENILLGGGHAVVADFGVSKALQEAGALTSAGMALGTPTYMAPEQATADPSADHRADLYAVAVVAYEMLTGAPPFAGTPSQLITAHLTSAPLPIKQRRSDVPDAVADVVMRALAKAPADRPQSAAELVTTLDAVTTPAGTARDLSSESTMPAHARASRSKLAWAAAIVGAVGLAAWGTREAFRPTVMRSAQSLAILPFSVADGDTALVRLGQNLVTTMSANLDGIGELHVADAMAVLSHARTKGPLLAVGDAIDISRRLGVRSAGYGTLARAGTNVQADLMLYDVRNPDEPTVRVRTTLPQDSIAALTDSLTWKLLSAIWARGNAPTPNVSSISTHSVVALRHFLDGERLFARFGSLEAAEAYKRAVEADTTFWFAHYRYRFARQWFGTPVDTTINNRLKRHLAELPVRERLLLHAVDSTSTVTARQKELSDLLGQYPDYAPALMQYADYIVHDAVVAGWDVRDAIPYFKRLAELMPSDLPVLTHLGGVCVMTGDRDCAERMRSRSDSILDADPAPVPFARLQTRFLVLALHTPSERWADSLAEAILSDTIVPTLNPLAAVGAAFAERPDRLIEQEKLFHALDRLIADDRRYTRTNKQAVAQQVAMWRSFGRMGRGDPTVLDDFARVVATMPPSDRAGLQPLIDRSIIVLELQGLRGPSPDAEARALELAGAPGVSGERRAENLWIAGVSALWRGDLPSYRARVADLAKDTTYSARLARRSLEALKLGRGGSPDQAAESLRVIEREHGERVRGRLWVVLAADRILGAKWLTESGRSAAAEPLLRYTRGIIVGQDQPVVTQATFGLAQLLRSRIAEDAGNKQDAIDFAKIFLTTFDLAPTDVAKPWRDEARKRIERLGGTVDAPAAVPVRVRP
jgi:serine/threonine-protein kinase